MRFDHPDSLVGQSFTFKSMSMQTRVHSGAKDDARACVETGDLVDVSSEESVTGTWIGTEGYGVLELLHAV